VHTIKPRDGRDALLYIPDDIDPEAPLIVSLHGAGGNARHGIEMLQARAEEHGFAVLAPASRKGTWDIIIGEYGPDVQTLDGLLSYAFEHVNVLADATAISGFSDGASYALSIGLMNGDLFHHILAFSPGFMSPHVQRDKPRIFISHGSDDAVLPVDRCSRRLVPQLRKAGYDVEYREFEGPHTIPENIKDDAIEWWSV
jgi:predicted esterase